MTAASDNLPSLPTYPSANPTRLRITRRILRGLGDFFALTLLFKVKMIGLEHVPMDQPGIVLFNHVNNFDPLLVALSIKVRDMVPFAKIELARSPLTGWMMWGWHVITVRRGAIDRTAIKLALAAIRANNLLLIAPEGHRNKGGMRNPREGIVLLAAETNALLIPMGVSGTENAFRNFFRLRRAPITIQIGQPFRLKPNLPRPAYKQAVKEMMYRVAPLVTPDLRGEFSDLSQATTETIELI